jgi:hypothetical protein
MSDMMRAHSICACRFPEASRLIHLRTRLPFAGSRLSITAYQLPEPFGRWRKCPFIAVTPFSGSSVSNRLGVNKDSAAAWFQELEHYGFVVKTAGGCLGVDGKGKAPHWRLTELGYMGEPPTKDYLSWKGERFRHSRKNRIPSEKTGQGVRRNRTVVSEESGHLTGELSEESGHTADIPCPNKPDISRITIWGGAGGSSIGEPGGGITATSSQAALLLGPVIVSRTSGHGNGSVDGGPAEGQCERCGKAAPLWQIKLGPGKHPPRYCRSCRQWWFRFRCRRNDGAEARI